MRQRGALIALALGVTAVVLQTTLFVDLRPFGATPNLPLLVVIAAARHLEPDPAVLYGFSVGLLTDLLGSSPLGMWALVMTAAAYVTLRVGERLEEAPLLNVVMVGVVTLAGEGLFLLLGTLFGLRLLSQDGIIRLLLLTSLYTMVLSLAVVPGVGALLASRRRPRVLGPLARP